MIIRWRVKATFNYFYFSENVLRVRVRVSERLLAEMEASTRYKKQLQKFFNVHDSVLICSVEPGEGWEP